MASCEAMREGKVARTAGSGSAVVERGAIRCEATVVDLGPKMPNATGICFLNHMIDQLVSHGQLGIGVQLSIGGVPCEPEVDYALQGAAARAATPEALAHARPHDQTIFELVGEALGAALRGAAADALSHAPATLGASRFCAPLDEAVTEAVVDLRAASHFAFSLEPYGTIPPAGREWIGLYRTAYTRLLWQRLHGALGGRMELLKLRGANAHHIVEATFKAFARALRAHLDAARPPHGTPPSAAPREGARSRRTKETSISVALALDPPGGDGAAREDACVVTVRTGVSLLDRILAELATYAQMRLAVSCDGDVHIDDHHTAEDVAIAVGQSLADALGTKAGCNRMGSADACEGRARVEVVVDLSNRPHFESDLELREEWADGMACEMVLHVFASLTTNALCTVHVVQRAAGDGDGACAELAIATARAYGLALRQCAVIDPRRAGLTASSKGTLSA
ncbi:hypothetical protein KFE25_009771 [Diacronema lutheri]|uniref:Imidazoleglycerol-phosphate dehydratase n=3 Tax=Diacronema lutheri TaxID=2081491 RepID=A0A8J5X7I1_DIALT|nr:hypothetical protein KFE25_009771 [Diacronema lutheri]